MPLEIEKDEDPMLSAMEIARVLQCSERFVREEVAQGNMRGLKLSGKMVRVRRSWFQEYLEAKLVKGKKKAQPKPRRPKDEAHAAA